MFVMKRSGNPIEIAYGMMFLMSDAASGLRVLISGSTVADHL